MDGIITRNDVQQYRRELTALWHNKRRRILIGVQQVAGERSRCAACGPCAARALGTRPTTPPPRPARRRSRYLASGVRATSANPPATSALHAHVLSRYT